MGHRVLLDADMEPGEENRLPGVEHDEQHGFDLPPDKEHRVCFEECVLRVCCCREWRLHCVCPRPPCMCHASKRGETRGAAPSVACNECDMQARVRMLGLWVVETSVEIDEGGGGEDRVLVWEEEGGGGATSRVSRRRSDTVLSWVPRSILATSSRLLPVTSWARIKQETSRQSWTRW